MEPPKKILINIEPRRLTDDELHQEIGRAGHITPPTAAAVQRLQRLQLERVRRART